MWGLIVVEKRNIMVDGKPSRGRYGGGDVWIVGIFRR
jgi:hypothetical protein